MFYKLALSGPKIRCDLQKIQNGEFQFNIVRNIYKIYRGQTLSSVENMHVSETSKFRRTENMSSGEAASLLSPSHIAFYDLTINTPLKFVLITDYPNSWALNGEIRLIPSWHLNDERSKLINNFAFDAFYSPLTTNCIIYRVHT